jgi:uncharacterized Zn finger protein
LSWYDYPPYVSAAERRRRGAREVQKRAKKGLAVEPVAIAGRTIARTFWGKAWCDHLEGYSDYANRLPRGRTYVRNGSVLHLHVAPGRIDALVQGSDLYEVAVTVKPLAKARWTAIVSRCAGQIDSLVELLQGKLSDGVMKVVTDRQAGLFPGPQQIELKCSCPDWAEMCKHVAAVLYGIGARLDQKPDLLFTLRKVDHLDLLSAGTRTPSKAGPSRGRTLAASDLGNVFGIDLDVASEAEAPAPRPRRRARRAAQAAKPTKTVKTARRV